MKKNSTKGYVILGILFALVSIIAFSVPTSKTTTFWIAYVFTAAAFAAQIVIWKTALGKEETLKSKFLGFPVVHIGIVYAVIQVIAFAVFMFVSTLPAWSAIVVCSVIAGVSAVCMISADTGRNEIERVEAKVQKKVFYIRELQADIELLVDNESDAAVKTALTLPDICSQIEHKTSESSKTNYINWVDGHFPPEYFNTCFNGFEEQTFTGNMCYSLRCSVLHSGSTDVKSTRLQVSVDKFVLTKPGDDKYYKGYTYSEETQDDGSMIKTTYIAIDYLCECLCDVAEEFYNNWPDKAAFDDHIFAKSDT